MGCWASGQVSVPDEKKNRATADEELSPITTQSLVLRALPSAPLACYTTQGKKGINPFPLFLRVFLEGSHLSLFLACCVPASYIPGLRLPGIGMLKFMGPFWLDFHVTGMIRRNAQSQDQKKKAAGCVPPF